MTRSELTENVTKLFLETFEAHREALGDAAERDPDWALWYAQHLRTKLAALMGRDSPCVDLVRVLLDAEDEHEAVRPDQPWAESFARYFVERCAEGSSEALSLYYYPTCPFCRRVTRVIDELGIDVELRDILLEPRYRAELLEARGRTTVPVLRCTSAESDRWMPESRDIIAYLQRRFGAS